jgi:hypothetical protein
MKIETWLFDNMNRLAMHGDAARHRELRCVKYLLINGGVMKIEDYLEAMTGGLPEMVQLFKEQEESIYPEE